MLSKDTVWRLGEKSVSVNISNTSETKVNMSENDSIEESVRKVIESLYERRIVINNCILADVSNSYNGVTVSLSFCAHSETGNSLTHEDMILFAIEIVFYFIYEANRTNKAYIIAIDQIKKDFIEKYLKEDVK